MRNPPRRDLFGNVPFFVFLLKVMEWYGLDQLTYSNYIISSGLTSDEAFPIGTAGWSARKTYAPEVGLKKVSAL